MDTVSIEVARAFIAAVNSGSAVRLAELMTEDHVFVDSDGAEYRGRSKMTSIWGDYFAMVPDYKIIVREMFAAGGAVMMAGLAEGTFVQGGLLKAENHWRVPAAWRAVIMDGLVAVWQIYVNPEPMEIILGRIRGE
jgi:ketosteroid isomerase-like protein